MKFVKDPEEEREDYILQKDAKTIWTTRLVVTILIILAICVGITSYYI